MWGCAEADAEAAAAVMAGVEDGVPHDCVGGRNRRMYN